MDKNKESATPPMSFRERVFHVVHSGKFQVTIIVLIVIDALLVVAVLLFDLKVFEHPDADNAHTKTSVYRTIPHALHYASLAILGLFLIEISFRIYAMRMQFFHHKVEVLDAIIVVISFVVDIVFRNHEGIENGIGLLIILRLWRVVRILNGMVLSIQMQAERKIEHQKDLLAACKDELKQLQDRNFQRETELEKLRDLVRAHGLELPAIEMTECSPTTCVDVRIDFEADNKDECKMESESTNL